MILNLLCQNLEKVVFSSRLLLRKKIVSFLSTRVFSIKLLWKQSLLEGMIMIINTSQHCNSCMRIRGSSPCHLVWSTVGWERSRQEQCLLNLSTANMTKKYSYSLFLVESWAFDRTILIENISGWWYLFSAENCSWISDHSPSYYNFVTLLKSFIYLLWLSYTLHLGLYYLGVLWPCDCCDAPFPCTNKVKEGVCWSA